jgi:hypothetical protein
MARLMPRHIAPLYCYSKVLSLVIDVVLTAILNLLGCSIANRAALINGDHRVVERVIDRDTLLMETVNVCVSSVWTRPRLNTPISPLSTSAKRLPHSPGVWWKASVCGWSLTRQMYHGLTRTVRNRGARCKKCFWTGCHEERKSRRIKIVVLLIGWLWTMTLSVEAQQPWKFARCSLCSVNVQLSCGRER